MFEKYLQFTHFIAVQQYFGQVHALRAFKNGDKKGIKNEEISLKRSSRGRSHSQAKNSQVEYKWRELRSKVNKTQICVYFKHYFKEYGQPETNKG